jgi:SAM-dependent methyltransferase
MNPDLQTETQRLERAWNRHEPAMLREYLVAGVEDPRINLQSVLSRHFLIRLSRGDRDAALMKAEYQFAAGMNQILAMGATMCDPEEAAGVIHGLSRGADQCEGRSLPRFLSRLWSELSAAEPGTLPNFLQIALETMDFSTGRGNLTESALNVFQHLWQARLRPGASPGNITLRIPVLEPACGSANDYRFVQAYGLGEYLDYTGLDLCAANIQNARDMFPGVRFEVGNVFEIDARDKSFAACYVHDLFEHLSGAGIEQAIAELSRVTRGSILAGCFNVQNIAEHHIEPFEDYHWNTLSPRELAASFARHGFASRVIHIGSFLRQTVGCDYTHNLNATTFEFTRVGD